MKENKNNSGNEKILAYVLVIAFCALIGLLAISSISGKKIGQTTPEPLKKVTTESAADTVRNLEKLELVENSNWEQVPYVMFQPDQLLADIAKVEESTDSKIEFPYEYNGNIVFNIGKSSISDKPYICINNVEENGNTMNRYFDLNKWSIFKANDNIIFATTDYEQGGLNEEFHFVEIDKSGNAKVQIKFIDLLGYDEEYDEICTLLNIEATLVRKGNNIRLVRDGTVIDEKAFPDEINKGWTWATDSYFLGDDGTLYYVLLDKSDSAHPTINCVKAGEGVSPRDKIQVAFDENGQKWNVFNDNGKDVVFVMSGSIWKDCSIASNRLTNIEEPDDTIHIPSSEWKISKVELETPQRFSLEYEQVKNTDKLQQAAALNEKDRAWWNIKFYYNDNIYTISAVPGIDENIFLDDEDVKTFDGKDYEIAELNAIREEMAVMYKKYVDEAYENYLKN